MAPGAAARQSVPMTGNNDTPPIPDADGLGATEPGAPGELDATPSPQTAEHDSEPDESGTAVDPAPADPAEPPADPAEPLNPA